MGLTMAVVSTLARAMSAAPGNGGRALSTSRVHTSCTPDARQDPNCTPDARQDVRTPARACNCLQGYLAHENPPPLGTYSRPVPRTLWRNFGGGGGAVSYEGGTPVSPKHGGVGARVTWYPREV